MLKKIIVLFVLFTVTLWGFEYNLKPKKISENIWCFFGALEPPLKENGGNMSNSCYIKTKNSYILVDAGPTYNFAQQAYKSMQKIADLPVKLVINTHDHDDHWLGSGYYKKRFNAKLIGPSAINKNYNKGDKTRMFHMLTDDAIDGTAIVKLDEEITNIKTIKTNTEDIVIIPVGKKAHSSEDLFIYLPKSKVLFSGDLVMNGRITSNRDGSVIGQLKALEMINSKGWETLVPGHGFDTTTSATNECMQYFTLLKQRIMKAIENDVGAEEVTKIVKLEEFKDKAMYKELNSRNVFEAYSELEFYEEE